MDIFGYISSVNKISLVVLALIFLFLLYELYLFKKESKKKIIVSVPSFGSTPVQSAAPPPPPQPQKEMPVVKKTHKRRLSKKNMGMMIASVLMIMGIGAISFRLSQKPSQNASVAPARPRAAELPSSSPTPYFPLSTKPTSIINTQAPTEVPPPKKIPPTEKPPLLFAKNISLSPTPVVFTTKENPTPTIEPSSVPKPTANPSVSTPSSPAPTRTKVESLPQSGLAHYSILFIALASILIVGSFLY